MKKSFDKLDTVQFQQRMKIAAMRIYERCFPGCVIEDLRLEGVKAHILDQEFAIDKRIHLPSQQWFTVQEKYRRNYALRYLEFTQEYKNAEGTQYESQGEWFKLAAQLYFYGWANAAETEFEKWVIFDIVRYKLLVEELGGLDKVGIKKHNHKHGKASFYAIPIKALEPAFVFTYKTMSRRGKPVFCKKSEKSS